MKRLLIILLILLTHIGTVTAEDDPPIADSEAPIQQPIDTTQVEPSTVDANTPSATFTVLRTANIQDGNIGDGICATGPTNAGSCTLFAAIQEANYTSAHDTINFNIPGAGPHIFNVGSGDDLGLPEITRPLTINGISQSGANCPNVLNSADLRIVLDGGGDQAHGLRLGEAADSSLIKGLVIINFATSGIEFNGADNVDIECNHIGVAANGTTAGSNGDGIRINDISNNNTIGGTSSNTRAERNVISGNSGTGIFNQNLSDGTNMRGNFIGTNATGSAAVPNGTGIWTRSQNAEIGGSQPYHANVISGNNGNGMRVGIHSADVLIDGNNIGTDAFGLFALPNGTNGITLDPNDSGGGDPAPTAITIGLLAPNRIAHNGHNGIVVLQDDDEGGEVSQVQWRTNRLYSNGQIGIDLGNNGITVNDLNDADTGPNGYQNWPVLLSAENSGRIRGNIQMQLGPVQSYALDVYQSSSCDPSGNGEGAAYLDTIFISGGGGHANFDEFIDPMPSAGNYISLIATDSSGNSSEFGTCRAVETATFVVNQANGGINSDDINPGDGRCLTNNNDCTLRAAIMEVNALGGDEPYNIYFDLGLTGLIHVSDSTAIPTITVPVNLDGLADNSDTSCPASAGAFAVLRVTISGFNLSANKDTITLGTGSDGSTIRGIAFVNAKDSALHITSDDNVVACSWFGFGQISAWNGPNQRGIDIVGDDNTIGGIDHADRNVIANSTTEGIRIISGGTGNVVSGNYIGTTQVGSAAAGNNNGIHISGATDNTIGGKFTAVPNVISGNTTHGILIDNAAHNNTIAGNIIGLDRTGSADLGNTVNGIRLNAVIGTQIGGAVIEERNVISGNNSHGIYLIDTEDTVVAGNYIGSDLSGTSAIGNSLSGLRDDRGDGNTIGGATTAEGNVIGGNVRNGIYLLGHTLFPTVQNNLIGLTADSSSRATIGNGFYGIHIDSDGTASATQTTLSNNTIAFNAFDGVRVDSAAIFTHLSANAIFENGWLGIDLDEDGENSPTVGVTITGADADADKITAEIDAFSNNQYRVDYFASADCDPSNYGEGQTYLGSDTITTNGSGSGDGGIISTQFDGGDAVTATLTRLSPAPETSEFSQCFTATGTIPTAVTLSGQRAVGGKQWAVVGLMVLLLGMTAALREWHH